MLQGRKSRSDVENKEVTDRTFMKFRGPQALTDMDEHSGLATVPANA
jgi:hypothetical protein